MNDRTSRTTLLDMALLFLATAILILPLFRIDYFDNWMIEGSFISDARFVRDHWPHPGWNALWYAGNRFDYAYTPGTRYGAAIAAMLFHVIPARGYHIYIGVMYCLGVSGLYFLARTGTGSRAAAWFAACAEALLLTRVPDPETHPPGFAEVDAVPAEHSHQMGRRPAYVRHGGHPLCACFFPACLSQK